MTWANRRRSLRSSWPVWLFMAIIIGMTGAYQRGASSVERTPAPVITVYVPAGPNVCAEESDCGTDWNGQRWVIVPGEVTE